MNFLQYLKEQKAVIGAALGCAAVFAGVLSLYHVTMKAVGYPLVLCVLFTAVYLALDYGRKRKKLLQLQRAFPTEPLPEPDTALEQAYQKFIGDLQGEFAELTLQQSLRYQDMEDYYTAWAHQVKTPISAMRLKLQNEDSSLSRQLSSDLLRIEQYVDMVMVYLRLGSPTGDYVLKSYSLDGMIRKSVSTFASEFISRGLAFHYEPVEETVITDEKWFCFVLEQLLSNALKYTRSGGITVSMEPDRVLCIRDTGMGIAPEDLPRIFQKGYTGFNGRADRHASGLGLYLCKRICDGLSIPISARSQPGQGTEIRLSLSQYPLKTE